MNIKRDNITFNNSSVHDCHIVKLPIVHAESGKITALNNGKEIPFDIRRIYYLYDVPGGSERGGHAHKKLHQLIIAASGSFDVILKDGNNSKIFSLNRPYDGLLVLPGIWRELVNFSSGSICLVMASRIYDEDDYIREYEDFYIQKNKK